MKQKVVVILGPTASDKSDLAVRLAQKFNGEVISADSRQVYKGLNIGTGKITKREMRGVKHHLLDVANPKKQFSVVQFVTGARKAIDDIAKRGKLPIVCGGTGFYISALLGEETIHDVPPNKTLRAQLAKKSLAESFSLLKKINPKRAEQMNESDRQNPRRLIRAIEIAYHYQGPTLISRSVLDKQDFDVLRIGIALEKSELRKHITIRLFARIRAGMIAEARRLHARGLSWKRMEELGLEYRYLAQFLQKKLTKVEMVEKLNTEIWRYAKRQMTWFKRDKKIHWFQPNQHIKIKNLVISFLLHKDKDLAIF